MEKFFSGYCRAQDQSRMVEAELENGHILDVDCSYPNCPFRSGCTIAAEIDNLTK